MFFWGPYGWLVIPALILALYAQFRVQSAFNKYARVRAASGYTGARVAQEILSRFGLHDVRVEPVQGILSDHYDPRTRVLRLSPQVYGSNSLSALGVAAHEAGHALQHAEGYLWLGVRSAMVPVATFGSQAGLWLFILGLLFGGSTFLMDLGILLFTGAVAFTLVTLPVEFNASARALQVLQGQGFVAPQEARAVKEVLDAAALTYVAAATMAIFELLRLILIRRQSD